MMCVIEANTRLLSPQVSKKYVSKELAKEIHAKAAPFVKWLKEAEEESEGSDDEEEEEEDENVEVSDKPLSSLAVSLSSDPQALHLTLYQ